MEKIKIKLNIVLYLFYINIFYIRLNIQYIYDSLVDAIRLWLLDDPISIIIIILKINK